MEVAEKEDGDSFMGDDSSSFIENYSSIDNCMELTVNTEKLNFNAELNFNVKNSYKDHTTFNKSFLPCKKRNYPGFNDYSGYNHFSEFEYYSGFNLYPGFNHSGFNQDSRFNPYSEFNLITNLTVSKVTNDSNKPNITSSVIDYRTRGVMGWQQKI
ncbi:hypothetical protein [uncultured Methanobacterium sp.]|uniref:hypothetical protein n=1 Tax=uncultured Methanobacterium sp. TaxID=176306 RepID=UPI002AA8D7DD|nr:hypothetical protein [uncultured Methanobacterium sp.]